MNQIAAVAEQLVKYPGGKVLVKPEFKIKVGVKWPIWFAQQPALPVSVLFAELGFSTIEPTLPLHLQVLQHLWRLAGIHPDKTPTLLIDVPLLFDGNDVADLSRPNDVPHCQRIRLATVLRSHLNDLLRRLHDFASFLRLGQHIGKGFFDVTVFACLYHLATQLRVLEISGRDHDAVDVLPGEHLLGVLINLRLEAERLPYLRSTAFSRLVPEITYGNRFHWNLLRGQLRHMYMTFAPVSASQLSQTDTIIGSENPGIGSCIHAGGH